jgi:hypothetical protein
MSAAPITAAAAATAIRTVLKVKVASTLAMPRQYADPGWACRSNERGRPGGTNEPATLCGT